MKVDTRCAEHVPVVCFAIWSFFPRKLTLWNFFNFEIFKFQTRIRRNGEAFSRNDGCFLGPGCQLNKFGRGKKKFKAQKNPPRKRPAAVEIIDFRGLRKRVRTARPEHPFPKPILSKKKLALKFFFPGNESWYSMRWTCSGSLFRDLIIFSSKIDTLKFFQLWNFQVSNSISKKWGGFQPKWWVFPWSRMSAEQFWAREKKV